MQKINKLLTLTEVAEILRVNRSSVSRLIKAKELSYIRIGGRKLIDEADLLAFIENRKVKSEENGCSLGEKSWLQ